VGASRARQGGALRVKAINRALEGIAGPTVVHICLGYGHLVKNKPSGYAFLPQLADSLAQQISLEAAQPQLDLGVLADYRRRRYCSASSTSAPPQSRPLTRWPPDCAPASPTSLPKTGRRPRLRMKYLPRDVAFGKLKALADGAAIVRRELV